MYTNILETYFLWTQIFFEDNRKIVSGFWKPESCLRTNTQRAGSLEVDFPIPKCVWWCELPISLDTGRSEMLLFVGRERKSF